MIQLQQWDLVKQGVSGVEKKPVCQYWQDETIFKNQNRGVVHLRTVRLGHNFLTTESNLLHKDEGLFMDPRQQKELKHAFYTQGKQET